MVELADIFRRHGPAYRTRFGHRMPTSHLAAMPAIAPCRPEALGGHGSQGTECGALESRDHTCQNHPCPTCQNDEATHWLDKPRALLLPLPSFLVTFSRPEAVRSVARSHHKRMDTLLFQPSAAALKALALDPQHLGGQSGMVGSSTPGPGSWPLIPISMISCLLSPCHRMAHSGSRPARKTGGFLCEPSPNSSVASARRH